MHEELKVKIIVSEEINSQTVAPNVTKNTIVAPILTMRSKYIPTALSFGVTILVNGIDFSLKHNFEIFIINEVEDKIIYSTGENILPENFEGSKENFSFNLDLKNIDIENEGNYKITFKFDNEEYNDYFEVKGIGK